MPHRELETVDPTRSTMRGTNQSGVRAHNERLVLSILRRDGALAKAEIARLTGLSAQTVSVIMRALEEDEMLLRDAPRRGKVGQPSVPMRLNPDAAYFHGLLIGRRWSEHVLVDMMGEVRHQERHIYDFPDFDGILKFAVETHDKVQEMISDRDLARVGGLGVAMPFQLWDWADPALVGHKELLEWRDRDFGAELGERLGYEVFVENDATAACAAELVFGRSPDLPSSFLHIFIGFFVGGGLVIDNRLFTGVRGNAGAIASMRISKPGGGTRQLYEAASLNGLGMRVTASGQGVDSLIRLEENAWNHVDAEIEDWIAEVVPALTEAIISTTALLDLPAVVIDGHMPEAVKMRMVEALSRAVAEADFSGLAPPEIRAGTVGPAARSYGAASLPLAEKFLV